MEKDNDAIQPSIPELKVISINMWVRRTLFFFMALTSTFSNFDNGINPASTDEIKHDLGDISDSKLGLFGSADYIGRIISSLIIYSVINTKYRKGILVFALILKALTLCLVWVTSNYWIILVSRGVSGFSQVFFTIYIPVWCDQYGQKKNRTLMIAMFHLGCPLGIVMGFGMCTLLKNWVLSYCIEGLLLTLTGIAIGFMPDMYFSNSLIQIEKENGIEFRELSESELEAKNSNILSNLKKIITIPVFIYIVLANSASFYAMGVMKFWTPDYMKNVLKIEDNNMITIAYSIISLTGPTFGIILGGLTGTWIGGYKVRKAILLCIVFDTCTCLTGLPSAFVNGFWPYCICVWLFFCFSTTLLPLETGIALVSVEESVRGDASTVLNFLLNAFGNLPPPFVYGIIRDYTEAEHPKLAMQITFYFRFIGIVVLILGSIYRYKLPEDPKVEIIPEVMIPEEENKKGNLLEADNNTNN